FGSRHIRRVTSKGRMCLARIRFGSACALECNRRSATNHPWGTGQTFGASNATVGWRCLLAPNAQSPLYPHNEEKMDVAVEEHISHIRSGLTSQLPDQDPEETAEWIESFDDLVDSQGTERAQFIVRSLLQRAGAKSVGV